jgi:hypothetical protein
VGASQSGDGTRVKPFLALWLVVAIAMLPVIAVGWVESFLGSVVGNDRHVLGTPLLTLGFVMSVASAIYAYVLGGRLWAAALIVTPALGLVLVSIFQEPMGFILLIASPITVAVGIVVTRVAPRLPESEVPEDEHAVDDPAA